MFKFRKYQQEIIEKAIKVCAKYNFVYLAMEVRTGKTLTAFGIAEKLNFASVLFVTKKKAISSIQNDYDRLKPNFDLEII